MTLNGIEVDRTVNDDETRDLIAEAGRIARGQTMMVGGAEHVRVLVDELGGALRSLLEDSDIPSAERARELLDRLEGGEG